MPVVSMTGNDTVIINNRTFADFAVDDICTLSYAEHVAEVRVGKNGNAIYALNENGRVADVVMNLVRGTPDDTFFNNLFNLQKSNFAGFPLMIGQFVKFVGDGLGNITKDTYLLTGGIFIKAVDVKSNVAGDVEQSVSTWTLKFSNSPRALVA